MPPLPGSCFPSGNDSNCVPTPSVDHDEQVPLGIAPDRHETGFLLAFIREGNREGVIEDRGSIREVHTMFSEVDTSLV